MSAATVAAVALVVLPGAVQAACLPPVAPVFSPFGDAGLYFPVANSGFEAGSASWALTGGAAVVAGDATPFIGASTDSRSLSLPAGSTATTASFCVDPTAPTMRFMVRNSANVSSRLALDVLFTRTDGKAAAAQVATFKAASAWAPAPVTLYYGNLLALLPNSGGTATISFRFRPLDTTGAWSIDDVYVDPHKRCC
jgi:hypothetical protein